MNYRKRAVLLISVLILSTWPATSAAADQFGDPYFLWQGTFALDPKLDPVRRSYRISTYLPPTTLFFIKIAEPIIIGGAEYTRIITQHGQDLLVRTSAIAGGNNPKKFKDVYGEQQFIFHEDSYMCPEDHKNCLESTGIEIRRGDVLWGEPVGTDFVRLKKTFVAGHLKETKVGYLTSAAFEQYKANNTLTDASQRYPRLLHKKTTQLTSIDTACGQTSRSINIKTLKTEISTSVEPTGFIPWISNVFNIKFKLGRETEDRDVVEAEYGGPNIATEHSEVIILEPDNQGNFDKGNRRIFYIGAQIECLQVGNFRQKIFVKSLSVKEGTLLRWAFNFEDFYQVEGTLASHSPQFKIFSLNGNRAYLTSINSWRDYEKAMKIWTEQIDDVSIAAIFMNKFNATCPTKKRGGRVSREVCQQRLSVKRTS